MPTLRPETVEQRRRQVLEAAWRLFAERGFHQTTMDDVVAASGMSTAAVYRYFRGKDELVDAAADLAGERMRTLVEEVGAREPPVTPQGLLTALVAELDGRRVDGPYDLTRVALEAWAESTRRPGLAARTRAVYDEMASSVVTLARGWEARGLLRAGTDPHAVAAVFVTMLPGLVLGEVLLGPVDVERVWAGLLGLAASP